MRRLPLMIACALAAAGCGARPARMNLLGRVAILDDGDRPTLEAPAQNEARYPEFFARVRRAVVASWKPDVAYLRHENKPLSGKRSIVVRVELAPSGALRQLTLLTPSGSTYLDEDALASVRRALPVRHPPTSLAGRDGAIRFDLAFLVELSQD